MGNTLETCNQCQLNGTSECPHFDKIFQGDRTCDKFKAINQLTEADFPLKIEDKVVAMFAINHQSSIIIDKLLAAIIKAIKLEVCNPWKYLSNNVAGLKEFRVELEKKGFILSYDDIFETIHIVPITR